MQGIIKVGRKVKRIAVAMSGGVDSSVAALVLKQQGFDVSGVTISFRMLPGQVIERAKRVADFLGIKLKVADFTELLEKKVIDNFCREYLSGRTPNPCLRCNHYLKFGVLLKQARKWGYDFLATGHYARKIESKKGFLLKKGKDRHKDQSYFLYRLTQRQLKHTLFPLGNLTKQKVVSIAEQFGLPLGQEKESQEICFLSGNNYRELLKKRLSGRIEPGLIVDKYANVLGKHQGVPFYTIGQREGLNIALGYRAYVVKIDARKNQVVLGNVKDVYSREVTITKPSFVLDYPKKRVVYSVKIRYNHKEARAEVYRRNKEIRCEFKQAQFAITPGQSAVFYDRDTVIGGGVIK